jgi:hypothetical protein
VGVAKGTRRGWSSDELHPGDDVPGAIFYPRGIPGDLDWIEVLGQGAMFENISNSSLAILSQCLYTKYHYLLIGQGPRWNTVKFSMYGFIVSNIGD